MIAKETLHLGQRVLYGEHGVGAEIDALTQTGTGIKTDDGRYIICGYADIYAEG